MLNQVVIKDIALYCLDSLLTFYIEFVIVCKLARPICNTVYLFFVMYLSILFGTF